MRSRCGFVFTLLTFSILRCLGSDPDSLKQNCRSFFLFNAGYRMPVNKAMVINSGHGLYMEGGLNLGDLVSKNSIIGLYAGFGFQDRLWTTSFNKNFSDDYTRAINTETLSGVDSSIITSSASLFRNIHGRAPLQLGCETKSFHNYSLYYGIILKMPCRFSPILKLYQGSTRSHYQGDGSIATKEKDFNIFELRRKMYGCEMAFPVTIHKCNGLKNIISISAYTEYSDLNTSSLYFYDGTEIKNIALSNFTNTSFRNRYRNEFYYGFKLSVLIN